MQSCISEFIRSRGANATHTHTIYMCVRSSTPVLSYYFQLILLSKQAVLVQLHVCHNVALQSNSLFMAGLRKGALIMSPCA